VPTSPQKSPSINDENRVVPLPPQVGTTQGPDARMHRLVDGHRFALHGGQANHARVQRPVRRRRLSATATGGGGAAARARRLGRRQQVAGRRVPAGGRCRTAAGRPGDRPAADQDVVEKVPRWCRGRGAPERRGGPAAAQQAWRRRRGP